MTNKHINIGDKEIHYKVLGNGRKMILLHGFGEDSDVWKNQLEELSSIGQLIIPDLPGSGKSDMIDDMSMEGMADAVYKILQNELSSASDNITTEGGCIMAGHSMGGYITLAFAEKYPSALRAFALVHSSAFTDDAEKKKARRKSIEFIRNNGSHAFLAQSTPNLFSEEYRNANSAVVEAMISQYKDFNPAALIAYYDSMMERPDRTHILKSFPKPVLFLIGKHDTAIPFAQSMQQCQLPQLAYIHILDHSGHMGMWEETEKTNIALATFFRDVYVI